jgi:LacI family transcriptional regulator
MDYMRSLHVKVEPTVADVAELAGVSTATVSRALSGSATVSESLRKRVQDASRKLSYKPNRIARNLRTRQTRAVGLIVPDIENPFYTSIVRGTEDVLQAADYSLVLTNSNEEPARERRCLDTLRAEGVAGIVFSSCLQQMTDYQELLDLQVPLVAVSRISAGLNVDTVTVAEAEGTRLAVAHLVKLRHKRIALINGPISLSTARERLRGYESALAAAGLPVRTELMQFTDFRQMGAYAAMKTLLQLPNPPTAVFVTSNLMTLGALQAIHESPLDIPRDIAVIGFDDMAWASSLKPPLTAVAQPGFDVGATAARLLLERLNAPARPTRHIMLDTRLIVRASCGSPAGKSAAA